MDDVRADARWITIADSGPYAGYKAFVRVRFPYSINVELSSPDTFAAALRKLLLKHNDWVNIDTGQLYAPTTDDSFWDEIPMELLLLTMRALGIEIARALEELIPPKPKPRMEADGRPIDYEMLTAELVRAMQQVRID